jgi:hypothetical protein
MWQSLPFLESLRSKIEILAATLTITAAILILLTRWPIARRISFLQAKEKEELQTRLASSLDATQRLKQDLAESSRQREEKEKELLQEIRVASRQSQEASDQAKALAKQSAPRTLSEKQMQQLRPLLAFGAGQKVEFEVPIGCVECNEYAKQIMTVFQAAGWQLNDLQNALFTGTPKGVLLKIAS